MSELQHFPGAEQLENFKILTASNFDEMVHQHECIVIDFWANWCVPCQGFATTFMEVATEFPDVLFAAVDIEAEQALADDFQIRSVPFVMIVRDEIVVFAEPGQMPASALRELLIQARELDMQAIKQDFPDDNNHNPD